MGDELARAAAEGNALKVRTMLGKQDPKGKKVQEAVCAAASKGQFEVMKTMLEWGASPLSRDQRDHRAFIEACSHGFVDVVEIMIQHQADVNDKDRSNKTPMSAAISGPHFDVIKALIRGGAEAPEDCAVRGVGQAIWEARLDAMTKQMKSFTDITVSSHELAAAEDKVWTAMREHMRLLELKEEKQAGDQLAKIQKLAQSEQDEERLLDIKVDKLSEDLRENQMMLLKEQSALRDLMAEIDIVKSKHFTLEEEDERICAEIRERNKELQEAQAASDSAVNGLQSNKGTLEELNSEAKSLQDEVVSEAQRKKSLSDRLQASESELEAWLRDKKEAAELTAQAHRLLGK